MSIAGSGVQTYWRPVLASQAIKLLAAPLLAVALAFVFGMSRDLSKSR